MYCEDGKSTRDIATIFNQKGYQPPSLAVRWNRVIKDPKWRKDSIAKYLKNTVYVGYRDIRWTVEKENKRRRKPARRIIVHRFTCPPIIDNATFQLAQERKIERSTLSRRNLQRPYLFRGIIRCAKCGLMLHPRFTKERAKWCVACKAKAVVRVNGLQIVSGKNRCKKHNWSDTKITEYFSYGKERSEKWDGEAKTRCKGGCGGISEMRLVSAIVSYFRNQLKKPSVLTGKVKDRFFKDDGDSEVADIEIELNEIRGRIKQLEQKRENIVEAWLDGIITTKAKRDERMAQIDDSLKPLLDKVSELQQKTLSETQKKERQERWNQNMAWFKKFMEKVRGKIKRDKTYQIMGVLLRRNIVTTIYVDFEKDMLKIHSLLGADKPISIAVTQYLPHFRKK